MHRPNCLRTLSIFVFFRHLQCSQNDTRSMVEGGASHRAEAFVAMRRNEDGNQANQNTRQKESSARRLMEARDAPVSQTLGRHYSNQIPEKRDQ